MKLLLAHGAEADAIDNSIPISGKAALHMALERGNADVVQLLLEAGASVNVKTREGRKTPLYVACENPAVGPELVELLLRHEAEVDVKCSHPEESPLLAALKSQRNNEQKLELVNLLAAYGADVESMAQNGTNPLNVAVTLGGVEPTRQLLSLGVSPNMSGGEHNWGSLNVCAALCCEGRFEVAKLLLDAEAAVNARDEWNETPLFAAIHSVFEPMVNFDEEDRLHLVKLLVCRGADVNWRNMLGRTPLHHACFNQVSSCWLPVIRFLLDEGADPSPSDVNGLTPLHFASEDGPDVTTDDGSYAEAAQTLLEYGADLEATSDSGATPFLKAVTDERPETMDEMLEYNLDYLPLYR